MFIASYFNFTIPLVNTLVTCLEFASQIGFDRKVSCLTYFYLTRFPTAKVSFKLDLKLVQDILTMCIYIKTCTPPVSNTPTDSIIDTILEYCNKTVKISIIKTLIISIWKTNIYYFIKTKYYSKCISTKTCTWTINNTSTNTIFYTILYPCHNTLKIKNIYMKNLALFLHQ